MPNPESLNILMVSTFEKKGGAAKAMQRLVKALKKEKRHRQDHLCDGG